MKCWPKFIRRVSSCHATGVILAPDPPQRVSSWHLTPRLTGVILAPFLEKTLPGAEYDSLYQNYRCLGRRCRWWRWWCTGRAAVAWRNPTYLRPGKPLAGVVRPHPENACYFNDFAVASCLKPANLRYIGVLIRRKLPNLLNRLSCGVESGQKMPSVLYPTRGSAAITAWYLLDYQRVRKVLR